MTAERCDLDRLNPRVKAEVFTVYIPQGNKPGFRLIAVIGLLYSRREHFHLRAVESFIKTGETQCEHGV
jgi:hypothetical protein